MPSWKQDIDRWNENLRAARGEPEPEEVDDMEQDKLTTMRDWIEDAAVIAAVDLKSDYLTKLFGVVLGRLASPECESYWVLRDRVAASLTAAEREGLVEMWELEYIDGKIGPLL